MKTPYDPEDGAQSEPVPRLWTDDEEFEPTCTAITGASASGSGDTSTAPPLKRPALLVITGRAAGRLLVIESSKMTIGRSRSADFTLSDEGVSRMHCGIACEGTTCFVSDLGSTHGTRVNGAPAEHVPLRPGDRIQLGPLAVLQFDVYDEAGEGLARRLYDGATRDLLTRALNRRAFQERLAAEVAYAVRHEEKLAAVAIAVDHINAVIDLHGQTAGEAVLCAVASSLASTLRGEDVLARIGGAGFVVLCRGLSLRNAIKLAERMRQLVARSRIAFEEERLSVTISAGVAALDEGGRPVAGQDFVAVAERRLGSVTASTSNLVRSRD